MENFVRLHFGWIFNNNLICVFWLLWQGFKSDACVFFDRWLYFFLNLFLWPWFRLRFWLKLWLLLWCFLFLSQFDHVLFLVWNFFHDGCLYQCLWLRDSLLYFRLFYELAYFCIWTYICWSRRIIDSSLWGYLFCSISAFVTWLQSSLVSGQELFKPELN